MKLKNILAVLGLTLALAPSAAAQCFGLDGLDIPGTTCAAGTTTSQQFRGFKQAALGICWKDCGVDAVANYTAAWGVLSPVINSSGASCGWYTAPLQLIDSSGQLAWNGQMRFFYSRTWEESAPGKVYQVWRFLVNGDLQPIIATSLPCGTPPCSAPNGNVVRFTGYVDYARECGTILFSRAWMLTHACDAIDHVAGFPRAGVYHPNRHYSFVGPSAGFAVGAGATIESGGAGLECLRKWDAIALPARCNVEEALVPPTGITPNTMNCMCGVGPANWYEGSLFAFGVSGTTVTPFPGSAPWRSFPVGQWTNPAVYPGVEEVRWNCNEAQWIECTGVGRQEFYFGVTTAGGYAAVSLTSTGSVPLPLTFVDQANSVMLPSGIATRNRLYRSDHILNLNF